MRILLGCLAAAMLLAGAARAAGPQPALTPAEQAEVARIRAIYAALKPQTGDVPVAGTGATLHLGKDYYFVDPAESRKILVDAWHNPPEAADGVLGLVFPAGKDFTDRTWSAVITYSDEGYVSDDDANKTDYNALIQQARDAEPGINARRKAEGVEEMHLIGWAQPPYYDKPHHTLIWAREIRFGDQSDHTLNYDLRALGRRGVLSMNILSAMSDLAEVRRAAAKLQNVGTFDPGARYADYKAGTDKKAEYGIAGLVAAGIGAVVVKKLGLLAIGLVFVKKFIALILAGFAGAAAWLRRLFTGKKGPPAGAPPALP
ncbi:MAG TPA: DUF2167 domain-containing protein [Rhizomicrobium sp.]|nr:DUF2167 domain-containing protein [Rhizomicrobium sp.]